MIVERFMPALLISSGFPKCSIMKTFQAAVRLSVIGEEKENINLAYILHHLFSKYNPVSKSNILYDLFLFYPVRYSLGTYGH